jgi:hypothetical protein
MIGVSFTSETAGCAIACSVPLPFFAPIGTSGLSLRAIVAETGLGIRTVRTIIGRKNGTDRTSQARKELRRMTFNKLRAARYRAKIKMRDEYLPKRLAAVQENHAALVKAAKGLGKR